MDEKKAGSAYRAFRVCAYRKKYETALLFGGKAFTYGALLSRSEYAYNTFRQMGVEAKKKVCLWLPDCPDLPACFYGLSRLGAVGVLCHPEASPREVRNVMEQMEASLLITTQSRYETYSKQYPPLPEGHLILCRPERDMKGKDRKIFLAKEPVSEAAQGYFLDRLLVENRYNANETPVSDPLLEAVILFGTSCFSKVNPISYLPEELEHTVETFARHRERCSAIFVENSFATEGGFLAVHSALCNGKTIVWSVGDPMEELLKKKPDFLVGTEELFWTLRQQAHRFKGTWSNLQGGIQIGKELTPLMEKFATKAFLEMGGSGALSATPVPLKVRKEPLYFVRDFGVRIADMEEEFSRLEGVAACRCIPEGGGIRLKLQSKQGEDAESLGRAAMSYCRREMNPLNLPYKVEFTAII